MCGLQGTIPVRNGSYCYPLTITDRHSRFLLACEGMAAIGEEQALEAFEDVFPKVRAADGHAHHNGVPFVTVGLAGLSRLNVYWLLLGIEHERSLPAHPQDNGRHEQMHRTLELETTRPARENLQQ